MEMREAAHAHYSDMRVHATEKRTAIQMEWIEMFIFSYWKRLCRTSPSVCVLCVGNLVDIFPVRKGKMQGL